MQYTGSCHCGAVGFAFEAELDELVRCDCSLCGKRNALMATVPGDRFQLTRGGDALCLYRWNTGVALHYFCGTCGIYVYHQRRSNPALLSVNACCIDGLDPESIPTRRVDGQSMSTVAKPTLSIHRP